MCNSLAPIVPPEMERILHTPGPTSTAAAAAPAPEQDCRCTRTRAREVQKCIMVIQYPCCECDSPRARVENYQPHGDERCHEQPSKLPRTRRASRASALRRSLSRTIRLDRGAAGEISATSWWRSTLTTRTCTPLRAIYVETVDWVVEASAKGARRCDERHEAAPVDAIAREAEPDIHVTVRVAVVERGKSTTNSRLVSLFLLSACA